MKTSDGYPARQLVLECAPDKPLSSYIWCVKTLQARVASMASPKFSRKHRLYRVALVCLLLICLLLSATFATAAEPATASLELSRPVRSWEFLPVVGTRAGLFGNEVGQMEAWVYPLKIFRSFHLTFHVDGRAVPDETLARTVIVHPESATIVYAGDNFSVRETFFVPVHEPGAAILFDVATETPIEIEASFIGDFQLEWQAAVGGTY